MNAIKCTTSYIKRCGGGGKMLLPCTNQYQNPVLTLGLHIIFEICSAYNLGYNARVNLKISIVTKRTKITKQACLVSIKSMIKS